MTKIKISDHLKLKINFIVLSILVWTSLVLYYGIFVQNELSLRRHGGFYGSLQALFFIAGSAIIFWSLLQCIDFFGKIRIVPKRSDLFVFATLTPIAGVLQFGLTSVLFERSIISLAEIWILSPLVATFLFSFEYLMELEAFASGRIRKKIVLALREEEKFSLIREFDENGVSPWVDFLTVQQLKESFLQRTEFEITCVVISRAASRDFQNDSYLLRAHLAGIRIIDRRELSTDLTGRIRLSDSDSWSFLTNVTKQTPLLFAYSQIKVLLEPILATLLAVFCLPLLLVVGIAIRITSRGPVLYRQVRTGYLGKPFFLFKFRTMIEEAEKDGPQWCQMKDRRITSLGKILRASRLDELPQLWNVMRGEMSFCGPRPERPRFYKNLKEEIPYFTLRTLIRPGITGWAQVCSGYANTIEESKRKLEFDLYYMKHVSPTLDLKIIVKTVWVALKGAERIKEVSNLVAVTKDWPLTVPDSKLKNGTDRPETIRSSEVSIQSFPREM